MFIVIICIIVFIWIAIILFVYNMCLCVHFKIINKAQNTQQTHQYSSGYCYKRRGPVFRVLYINTVWCRLPCWSWTGVRCLFKKLHTAAAQARIDFGQHSQTSRSLTTFVLSAIQGKQSPVRKPQTRGVYHRGLQALNVRQRLLQLNEPRNNIFGRFMSFARPQYLEMTWNTV